MTDKKHLLDLLIKLNKKLRNLSDIIDKRGEWLEKNADRSK